MRCEERLFRCSRWFACIAFRPTAEPCLGAPLASWWISWRCGSCARAAAELGAARNWTEIMIRAGATSPIQALVQTGRLRNQQTFVPLLKASGGVDIGL